MSRWLVLHLDAPLMSFGRGVDQNGVTEDHPSLSMMTGLVGNALGLGHGDVDALDALQARLILACREEAIGTPLVDYQTVDLGQSFMIGTGWTTRGCPEGREGGFSQGTHIRFRHFLGGAVFTVVLGLRDGEGPTLDDIHDALVRPARPLFLGRKPCLPSRPLVPAGAQAWVEAATVGEAIRAASGPSRVDRPRSRRVWYPADADGRHTLVRRDLRNWRSDTHEGSRLEAMEVWDE